MSVCKGKTPGTSGKENRSHFAASPSPAVGSAATATAATRSGSNGSGGGGGSSLRSKENGFNSRGSGGDDVGVKKFDLMPPPMPRTPGGGKSTGTSGSAMRTTPVVSPLQKHDPNQQQQQQQQQPVRPERLSSGVNRGGFVGDSGGDAACKAEQTFESSGVQIEVLRNVMHDYLERWKRCFTFMYT